MNNAIIFQIDKALNRRIKHAAMTQGISVMGWIRMALIGYLDRAEKASPRK